jgi:hypothetical protein
MIRDKLHLASMWERRAVCLDLTAGVLNPTELDQAQHEAF